VLTVLLSATAGFVLMIQIVSYFYVIADYNYFLLCTS